MDKAPFPSLLAEAFDRKRQKQWAKLLQGTTVSRAKAVEIVSEIFATQLSEPSIVAGPGLVVFEGLMSFGEYFTSVEPSKPELDAVIERANDDYYAFLALKLLRQISKGKASAELQNWETRVYFGLAAAPPKPPGPGRYKLLHRDHLIIGQILELEEVGYKPTRNDATTTRNSGCDIVADALARNGSALSYAAVETVWKRANTLQTQTVLGNFLKESIIRKAASRTSG